MSVERLSCAWHKLCSSTPHHASTSPPPSRLRPAESFLPVDWSFVHGALGVRSAIAFPRLLLACQSAGAASALGSLRSISSAELTFALTCGGGFYAPSLPDLGTPPPGSP